MVLLFESEKRKKCGAATVFDGPRNWGKELLATGLNEYLRQRGLCPRHPTAWSSGVTVGVSTPQSTGTVNRKMQDSWLSKIIGIVQLE